MVQIIKPFVLQGIGKIYTIEFADVTTDIAVSKKFC